MVYRYPPLPALLFQFDGVRVFERIAGRGSWNPWERDGTIIIPELTSFPARPNVCQEINVESDVYRRRHRSLPGLGWPPNMFHRIIHQTSVTFVLSLVPAAFKCLAGPKAGLQ